MRMEWNGMEWNGMEWNGMEWNGMEWNGMSSPEDARGEKLASNSASMRATFATKNRNFCRNCCRVCATTASLSAWPLAIMPICTST